MPNPTHLQPVVNRNNQHLNLVAFTGGNGASDRINLMHLQPAVNKNDHLNLVKFTVGDGSFNRINPTHLQPAVKTADDQHR